MSTPILAASAFISASSPISVGLIRPSSRGFDGAPQSHVGQRPDDRRGDGRQRLAALDELVKDVVVGGMADQWVNGYSFSQRGKIAHVHLLPAGAAELAGLTHLFSPQEG